MRRDGTRASSTTTGAPRRGCAAARERPQQQARDRQHHAQRAQPRAPARPVDRPHRHVDDAHAAPPPAAPADRSGSRSARTAAPGRSPRAPAATPPCSRTANRTRAVARRHPRRHDSTTLPTMRDRRHHPPAPRPGEPVALDVVGLARRDRREQARADRPDPSARRRPSRRSHRRRARARAGSRWRSPRRRRGCASWTITSVRPGLVSAHAARGRRAVAAAVIDDDDVIDEAGHRATVSAILSASLKAGMTTATRARVHRLDNIAKSGRAPRLRRGGAIR